METALHASAALLSQFLEAATLVLLTLGALLAVKNLIGGAIARLPADQLALHAWQGLSRWIMVGLEFLLASDLVSTVVAPSWDELGRLATIAAIRTLLGYFLGRDLEAARKVVRENAEMAEAAAAAATAATTATAPAATSGRERP
jgi:uncharacterized membrane protein